jgi:ABC-2 type transport system permease protein
MSTKQMVNNGRLESPVSAVPVWRLVALRELSDLWIGGRALILLILYSVLLGIMAYLLSTNSELSLIPPKEMVFLILQAAISVGLFIGVIIGADSISGELERATLEALLLTPTSRRQIVVGKFLAAISPWPAALIISIPYFIVLAQGDEVWMQAVLWGAILGTLLIPGFTGFSMLVSLWSNSNRTSLFVSLIVYLLCLLPTQFPGTAQTGNVGRFVKSINPMEALNHFLEKVLVNNRTMEEMWIFLLAPAIFALIVAILLFWYAGSELRLEAGKVGLPRPKLGRVAGLFAAACLILFMGTPATMAFQEEEPTGLESALQVSIDTEYKVVKTGDEIEFTTTVTNNGEEESPPLIMAMNIVNIEGDGDPVDPEDWSPERARYIEPVAPGESVSQTWVIHAILEGDYMVYMAIIPEPDGEEATSLPVSSPGIHVTVELFVQINPGGVLPLALGMPIGLTLGTVGLMWVRRRGTEMGGSS